MEPNHSSSIGHEQPLEAVASSPLSVQSEGQRTTNQQQRHEQRRRQDLRAQRIGRRLRQQGRQIMPRELLHALQREQQEELQQSQQALQLRQQEELQRSQQMLQLEHQQERERLIQALQRDQAMQQQATQQQRQSQQPQQASQQHLPQRQPRVATAPPLRRLGPDPYENAPSQSTPLQSPASAGFSMSSEQRRRQQQQQQQQEQQLQILRDYRSPYEAQPPEPPGYRRMAPPRYSPSSSWYNPSLAAAPAANASAAPPPPRDPPRRSNILDLLNDEPSEPPRQSLSNPAPSGPAESDIIREPTYENQDEARETGLGEYSYGLSPVGEEPGMDEYQAYSKHEGNP